MPDTATRYTLDTCPKKHLHTKSPDGYLEWHAWAEKKSRRHVQVQCPGCGLWAIWRRRPA